MRVTLATLTLCLVQLAASGFPFDKKPSGSTVKERRMQYAAWDDINIIAHGLLQLGQGLKEHVDKAKVQMRDISSKLNVFNHTVMELSKESQRLQAEGQGLKALAWGLEGREGQLLNITAELKEKMEAMQQERRMMSERMSRLEDRVDSMLQGGAARNTTDTGTIQVMMETQSRRLDDLMDRISLQQEKLDKQNVRIRTLQSQIQQSRERTSSPSANPDHSYQPGIEEQSDSPIDVPSDCHKVFLRGMTTSGVYVIQPNHQQAFKVFCEMKSDGGWTVIQRRQDGSVDFDQLWQAYKEGFGSLNGEFWLGLEKIHSIAKNGGYVLKVQMTDWQGDIASIHLPFRLGGEDTKYSLYILKSKPFSPLENSLATDATSSLLFSTSDQDNDTKSSINCAKNLSGGWWFTGCGRSNLNGRYFQSPPPKKRIDRKQCIFWKTWRGRYYPLKTSTMMIGPAHIHRS
ncbi:angiopoietin-related protein 4-like [Thalassophryne amazonica]|uniref:angiopoietin-related protein 4-like n=1 Tax=Thalassophryne amazonica TaxID=390379 RepID=UPI001470F32A|nr:angiopoietin-related protein 4-like [Thalassophryne amazonica]